MKHTIEILKRAEKAGVGGNQRDLIERAIVDLADEFAWQHHEAGTGKKEVLNILRDCVDSAVQSYFK